MVGKNHARYFDENNWFYFTKQFFDLLYPSYGDTYPTFNGAIGMTYEQAGGEKAGLGIKTNTGDTLTLKDRIIHHYTTGLSTIEVASENAEPLEKHFIEFYRDAFKLVSGRYNTYIIKNGEDDHKLARLASILDLHKIKYGQVSGSKMIKGYDYHRNRNTVLTVNEKS